MGSCNFIFLLLCLAGMVVNQLFSLILCPHFCTVNLGAHVKTQHFLCVSTVASRIQSGVDHIYHISLIGIEIAASLCNFFSPHLC